LRQSVLGLRALKRTSLPGKPRKAVVLRTAALFKPYTPRIILLLALIAATAVLELAPALLIGAIVDEPLSGQFDANHVLLLGLATAAMYTGSAIMSVFVTLVNSTIGHDLIFALRGMIHRHVQSLSQRFFTTARTGEIISRVGSDINQIEVAVTNSFTQMANSLMMIAIALALMISLDWRLSVLAILVLAFWSWPTLKVGQYMRSLQRAWAEEGAKLYIRLEETMSISGAQLVRAFGREEYEAERFNEASSQLRKLAIRRRMVTQLFESSTRFFGSMSIAFVFWMGSQWVADGTMSIGAVVAFAVLTQKLFHPMAALGHANLALLGSFALFERIFEYLDQPVDVADKADAVDLTAPRGHVTFEDVSFRYDASEEPAIQNLSFSVGPGEMVALVGPSGAGKTTVTYLLQRFYDPESGRVLLDGHDLRDITLGSVSRAVGTVMQDTTLFHSTLADNIRYGRLDATDEEVMAAARAAALEDLISRLPKGLDTVVGERGFRLSGGEKQRVSIARVILKDPPVLIMDEATSALDSRLEREVREATEHLARGRATVVIAHRLSTVLEANTILVMSEGRVVERGTHAELLQMGGLYASLYREQFLREAAE
jgi:ATP-binding cassette subfamily B protein